MTTANGIAIGCARHWEGTIWHWLVEGHDWWWLSVRLCKLVQADAMPFYYLHATRTAWCLKKAFSEETSVAPGGSMRWNECNLQTDAANSCHDHKLADSPQWTSLNNTHSFIRFRRFGFTFTPSLPASLYTWARRHGYSRGIASISSSPRHLSAWDYDSTIVPPAGYIILAMRTTSFGDADRHRFVNADLTTYPGQLNVQLCNLSTWTDSIAPGTKTGATEPSRHLVCVCDRQLVCFDAGTCSKWQDTRKHEPPKPQSYITVDPKPMPLRYRQ